MLIDKPTINDYVKDLTVASPSQDWNNRVFKFTPQTSDEWQRVVCFNPKKHKLLSKIHQDETGWDIKR